MTQTQHIDPAMRLFLLVTALNLAGLALDALLWRMGWPMVTDWAARWPLVGLAVVGWQVLGAGALAWHFWGWK